MHKGMKIYFSLNKNYRYFQRRQGSSINCWRTIVLIFRRGHSVVASTEALINASLEREGEKEHANRALCALSTRNDSTRI